MQKTLWMAAAATIAFAGAAHANITPKLTSVTAENGNFRYLYTFTLDTDQGLVNGSKSVIFDFAGYVPGSEISSDARFVAGIETFTSGMVTPPMFTDDKGVPNLTLTWNGGPFKTVGPSPTATDFTLSALSKLRTTTFDGYTSTAVKNNGPAAGQRTDNEGPIEVPFAAGVPEPASWALLILGFGGVGSMIRARQRRLGTA